MEAQFAQATLNWMEKSAPWRLKVASFYEQWELHLDGSVLPTELQRLVSHGTIRDLKKLMLSPMTNDDLQLIEVTAHKLVSGQTIRIHNDYIPGEETHRLLVQLNRGWSDNQGGVLMLFGSSQPNDIRRALIPTSRSSFAFESSPASLQLVEGKDLRWSIRLGHFSPEMRYLAPAPWDLFAPDGAQSVPFELTIVDRLSKLPVELANVLASDGFQFWDYSNAPLDLIKNAARWIDRVPGVSSVCSRVIGELHLLRAEPGYDVSHSEPRWRRKIFVSIPERYDEIGEVRLAESLIHEAMHLQLTDFEAVEPLVSNYVVEMPSPWKSDARPFQGVLHGLFVFACISEYFTQILRALPSDGLINAHCKQRIMEIAAEVRSIDLGELSGGLTAKGVSLARRWYNIP
jgi:2OG-Fe(II) oxygenase superfamily